ncbi:MAG: hypothetical protein JSS81_15880 [Acidobacteria bacterium]|nr:hypothetical protein [Acidobacteriota bacterium]
MKIKRILTLLFIFGLFLTVGVNAQTQDEPLDSFKVGDLIYYGYMINWRSGTIEEFSKNRSQIKIRYGQGRYDTTWITPGPKVIIQSEKLHLEMTASQKMGLEMRPESLKYMSSIVKLMQAYDPELTYAEGTSEQGLPTPDKTEELNKVRQDLAQLDEICKTRFPNIRNPPSALSKKWIVERYGDQCAIAADRVALEKKQWQLNAERNRSAILDGYRNQADNNIGNGLIYYDLQLMALDFDGWKAAAEVKEKAEFVKAGAVMPPNFFDRLRPISVEVKAFIDKQSSTNRWVAPKFQDAAAQALAKRNATDEVLKRSTILAIGMDDAAWVRGSDSKNEVGRDSKYIYYKIEKSKNSYKIGRMLVKGPVAGYCQEREFVVRRTTKVELEILDGSGKFVACPK